MRKFAIVALGAALWAVLSAVSVSAAPNDKLMAQPWRFIGTAAQCGNIGAAGTNDVDAEWQAHQGLADAGKSDHALYLAKMQLTSNCAASGASIRGAEGMTLTEIGWDVRGDGHCGAGAPRFNVVTSDNVLHFIGCSSPPPTSSTPIATGWTRMRYNPATAFPPILPTSTIKSIDIVFDEGTDQGQGYVYLDNIDINGTLIGKPGAND